jgi:hypothetical protein
MFPGFEMEFNFWKNDKEARKMAKDKIREMVKKNNLIEVKDWHISRIAGSLMSYLDIMKCREPNELLDELEVDYSSDSEEIVLNLRGTSLNFNKKATWLGSLSAI